jgi:ribosome-associated toxin RatA of RatAB toxin-antitoxin module
MPSFAASFTGEIDAPVERCFEIVTELERAPEWQASIGAADVLERDAEGRPALADLKIEALVASVTIRFRFSYDEPLAMEWRREGGDLRDASGSWRFEDAGEGRTSATYSLDMDPGRVLSMLARGPVVARVRNHVAKQPVDELRKRAEEA